MSSKNSRLRVALLTVAVAVAGLTLAGSAAAATPRTATTAATAQQSSAAMPLDFVDLATSPLPAGSETREVTVTYRNDSTADQTVAPQLLVESPDAGPFLDPTDVRVEQRTATGWKAVDLGSQTGTLFTDLTAAQRTLPAGDTLTEVYRVTVTDPAAEGTVHPRIALY